MDKKEPPDNNGKVKFSQSKPRSKSKTGDRRFNPLPQPSILYPRPHSYVETQPSLLRRRLMDAQHSYVPSYTGSYRSPCESSCHYGRRRIGLPMRPFVRYLS
uniref:Uncharacterized protein n=1 Tax=Cacopsylla melanoneura TaxID=428564 RepID=A0A8D8R6J8_9HEMI